MKFLKCCWRICVALDMLVLLPIFGTSTMYIPSGHTNEVFELLWAYLCGVGYGGSKTNIRN